MNEFIETLDIYIYWVESLRERQQKTVVVTEVPVEDSFRIKSKLQSKIRLKYYYYWYFEAWQLRILYLWKASWKASRFSRLNKPLVKVTVPNQEQEYKRQGQDHRNFRFLTLEVRIKIHIGVQNMMRILSWKLVLLLQTQME